MDIYREKTDKKFLETDTNFKLLYDRTPIPYHSLDKNGNILDVNLSWLEKLGYERNEVVGKWFGNFIDPEYVETFKESFSGIINNGELLNVNFDMKHKDGNRINVAIDCKASYDLRGYYQQTHCIFTDISEQKRTEKALKESEQYYKTIFENTGTATVIIEEDNTISLINTEFEKLYGYYKDDIEGKKGWHQFVDDKFLPMMDRYHKARRIKPESAPRNYEFDFIDSRGSLRNIYAIVAMIPGTKKSLVSLQEYYRKDHC
jgi:PAS domain S-box-containing protein